jgi:hypothetical protein
MPDLESLRVFGPDVLYTAATAPYLSWERAILLVLGFLIFAAAGRSIPIWAKAMNVFSARLRNVDKNHKTALAYSRRSIIFHFAVIAGGIFGWSMKTLKYDPHIDAFLAMDLRQFLEASTYTHFNVVYMLAVVAIAILIWLGAAIITTSLNAHGILAPLDAIPYFLLLAASFFLGVAMGPLFFLIVLSMRRKNNRDDMSIPSFLWLFFAAPIMQLYNFVSSLLPGFARRDGQGSKSLSLSAAIRATDQD